LGVALAAEVRTSDAKGPLKAELIAALKRCFTHAVLKRCSTPGQYSSNLLVPCEALQKSLPPGA
jgi:hypothetical protein